MGTLSVGGLFSRRGGEAESGFVKLLGRPELCGRAGPVQRASPCTSLLAPRVVPEAEAEHTHGQPSCVVSTGSPELTGGGGHGGDRWREGANIASLPRSSQNPGGLSPPPPATPGQILRCHLPVSEGIYWPVFRNYRTSSSWGSWE